MNLLFCSFSFLIRANRKRVLLGYVLVLKEVCLLHKYESLESDEHDVFEAPSCEAKIFFLFDLGDENPRQLSIIGTCLEPKAPKVTPMSDFKREQTSLSSCQGEYSNAHAGSDDGKCR